MAKKKTAAPAPQYPRFFQHSPIDLKDTIYHAFDLGQVAFQYPLTTMHGVVEGEPHHAKVTLTDDVRIPLFGLKLKLQQLHFHAPSEHLVSGVAWPLELHLVHQIEGGQSGATVGSDLLVIGIFFFASEEAPSSGPCPRSPSSSTRRRSCRNLKAIGSRRPSSSTRTTACPISPTGHGSTATRARSPPATLTSG